MALLTAHDLRLTQHGLEVFPKTSFGVAGPRCVIVGAPTALFEAAAGVLAPAAGTLDLHGHEPLHAGAIRAYPKTWTALEWLAWRLRLVAVRAQAAHAALAAFGLAAHGITPLGKAPRMVHNALPLVAAIAARSERPSVIVLDDAFAGLDDETAGALATTFVASAVETPWIAFLPLLSLRSPLAAAAAEAVVIDAGMITGQGAPADLLAQAPSYVVRVLGHELPWAQKLDELGIQLVTERSFTRADGTGKELTVAFGEGRGPRDLFALAAHSADVIVELFPASGKLV